VPSPLPALPLSGSLRPPVANRFKPKRIYLTESSRQLPLCGSGLFSHGGSFTVMFFVFTFTHYKSIVYGFSRTPTSKVFLQQFSKFALQLIHRTGFTGDLISGCHLDAIKTAWHKIIKNGKVVLYIDSDSMITDPFADLDAFDAIFYFPPTGRKSFFSGTFNVANSSSLCLSLSSSRIYSLTSRSRC